MRTIIPIAVATVFPLSTALPGCGLPEPAAPAVEQRRALGPAPTDDPNELREDRSVYDQDNLAEVPVIRLTVTDLAGLRDVHDDVPEAEVDVLFQEGTFGEGLTEPNGKLSLRGKTGRSARLKPYKVVLNDNAGRWKGQKRIHLFKHHYDLTRVRSYLAFEYFKTLRHMSSMRHQFVRVYLNGQDQGLYEWIENPGRRFLESHGLDRNGTLYNVQLFFFRPYDASLFDCEDEDEHCLEIEENHDPERVRRMLDAVNDYSRDINDVIATFFQRDNYETWLALQMLFTNFSTASHNYLLYSPSRTERWYFLPWDYNGAFGYYQQPNRRAVVRSRAMVAPNYWWNVTLHQRYLGVPANMESLQRRIRDLCATSVTDAVTQRILGTVRDIVRSHLERDPDLRDLPVTDRRMSPEEKMREWEAEWTRIGGLLSQACADFERTVQWPMSVWLGTPSRRSSGAVRFRWDASYDAQGDGITYDFRLSRSPTFEADRIVAERMGLTQTALELPRLRSGTYYYTVIIRDSAAPEEHWQIPFSRTTTRDHNVNYWGVKQFTLR